MAKQKPQFTHLAITIQAGDERVLVPGNHSIVARKGIFVLDRQLDVDTPIVVRMWSGQRQ